MSMNWNTRYATRLASMSTSVIRDILKTAQSPDAISMSGGWPDAALFPTERMAIIAEEALAERPQLALQYGPTQGLVELRTLLAERMRTKGIACHADDIVITTGSQQALDLVGRILLDPGDRVLVLGTGGLGMQAIQIAKAMGATVYATSRQDDKLEAALDLGCDGAVNTRKQDLRKEIERLTGGEMCDSVLDNIGIETSIEESLMLVRPAGRVIIVGYNEPCFRANYQNTMKYEKEIIGMRGSSRDDLRDAIALVEQGKVVPYITKTVPLEEINEALGEMRRGSAKGRIVIKMD